MNVELKNNYKGWTSWNPVINYNGQTDCFYKTNGKKVIVKFLKDNIKAEACCNKIDEFNLAIGIQIAYLRCLNKALNKQKIECEEKIKEINHDIAGNNNSIQKLIDSLV